MDKNIDPEMESVILGGLRQCPIPKLRRFGLAIYASL